MYIIYIYIQTQLLLIKDTMARSGAIFYKEGLALEVVIVCRVLEFDDDMQLFALKKYPRLLGTLALECEMGFYQVL